MVRLTAMLAMVRRPQSCTRTEMYQPPFKDGTGLLLICVRVSSWWYYHSMWKLRDDKQLMLGSRHAGTTRFFRYMLAFQRLNIAIYNLVRFLCRVLKNDC
jgi:hypothetical protein